jgi:hypothetical protein
MSAAQDALIQLETLMASDHWLKKVIFIIGVIIICVVVLSIGTTLLSTILQPSTPYIVNGMMTGTNNKTILPTNIPIDRSDNKAGGLEFTWAVWLNITNLDPGGITHYRHIFSKGDNDKADFMGDQGVQTIKPINAPGLFLDSTTNSLIVVMNTFESIDEMVRIDSVPLNKWINVVIRVRGLQLDVYINGLVVKSKTLESVPRQNNGSVYISENGGFHGYLSNLRYYNYALEPGDIIAVTEKGPNLKISSLQAGDLKFDGPYLSTQWYFQ